MKAISILTYALLWTALNTAQVQAKAITGFATYYTVASAKSEGTSGTLTASGARYDESKMTCALPRKTMKAWSMKFGAKLRATNLQTGATAILILTDVGPGRRSQRAGTVTDLTPRAFIALGGKLKQGKIKVRIEAI